MAKNRPKLIGKTTVHKNIDQDIVVVSTDKMRLHLIEYQNVLKSRLNLVASITALASLGVNIAATSEFRDVFFIPAVVCDAIIHIGFLLSATWLLITLIHMYGKRDRGGINELIDLLKGVGPRLESEKESRFLKRLGNIILGVRGEIETSAEGGDI
jgi:hypothetical protein